MRTLRRSAPLLLVLVLLLVAGLIVYSQSGDQFPSTLAHLPADPLGDVADVGLPIGIRGPEIEGKDVDGNWFKLSDYRGKVVVLDCWVER